MPVSDLPRLGDLETTVMEYVWSAGPSDVKAVHRVIGERRGITLNTVQSTMERLFRKGLLAREKVSHAFVYSARQTRAEMGARIVEEVVSGLLKEEPAPMLQTFVDVAARAGAENLDELERLIALRKKGRR